MKIEYMTGHYSMKIDGEEFAQKSLEECKQIVHKLVEETTDVAILQDYVEDFMESHADDYKNLGNCSVCGDYIEKFTYTTKK